MGELKSLKAVADRELVRRLQAGDDGAVNDFARDYRPRIQQLALRYLKNAEDAEEVTQDVLLKAVAKIADFRGDAALSSWLYRVTFNASMSRLRHLRATRSQTAEPARPEIEDGPASPEIPDWSAMADELALRRQMRRRLATAVRLLPEIYRAPVILRDFRGLSTEEASSALRVNDQTLKSRLHRGRLLLRRHLSDFADGLGAPSRGVVVACTEMETRKHGSESIATKYTGEHERFSMSFSSEDCKKSMTYRAFVTSCLRGYVVSVSSVSRCLRVSVACHSHRPSTVSSRTRSRVDSVGASSCTTPCGPRVTGIIATRPRSPSSRAIATKTVSPSRLRLGSDRQHSRGRGRERERTRRPEAGQPSIETCHRCCGQHRRRPPPSNGDFVPRHDDLVRGSSNDGERNLRWGAAGFESRHCNYRRAQPFGSGPKETMAWHRGLADASLNDVDLRGAGTDDHAAAVQVGHPQHERNA